MNFFWERILVFWFFCVLGLVMKFMLGNEVRINLSSYDFYDGCFCIWKEMVVNWKIDRYGGYLLSVFEDRF